MFPDWSKDIAIDCLPFTVDAPATPFTAQYALKDKANQFIAPGNAPVIIVTGQHVGTINHFAHRSA